MTRMFLLPVALIAALLVATAAGASTQTVQITKNGFTPVGVTITVGDTVTWHNADTADHQVVANDGSFASPVLHADQSYSHVFNAAGKVTYHDAFAKAHAGTVTVNGSPVVVTLSASPTTVVYGSGTSLSGAVSNQLTNEPVLLTAQPFGRSTQSIDTTTTSSNGTFSFGVSPTFRTTYTVHWRTVDSSPVTVNVAPRVGFGLSGRLFIAKATSDLNYGGHYVWVQRHSSVFGWVNIKRVYFGSTSRAAFMLRLRHGLTTLRLVLPLSQAGDGYVAGLSRTIIVKH